MDLTVFDHPLITERYFFPMKINIPDPYWVKVDGAELACYYSNAFPDAKTIILFHGNGEVVADYMELYLPLFSNLGLNCFIVEYRGYGMSSGVPMLGAALKDTRQILDYLNLPPEKLIVFGRSLGSLYALEAVGYIPDISGLIIESGIADILERVLLRVSPSEIGLSDIQLEEEVNLLFNHKSKLKNYNGSTLVMHAQHDSLVPSYHGSQIFDWAPDPKMLKLFPIGDHNSLFIENEKQYFSSLKDFLVSLK